VKKNGERMLWKGKKKRKKQRDEKGKRDAGRL